MQSQLPKSPLKYDAFISYSHKNKDGVDKLITRLRADGFQLWIDEEQIGGGDPLRQVIIDGIAQSKHVIVCLSQSYIDSKWTTFESAINQTLDIDNRNRRLIPVRVARVEIPLEYQLLYCPDLINIDTWEQEYQKTIKHLLSTQQLIVDETLSTLQTYEDQPVGPMSVLITPQYPPASPRLKSMGFLYHPFVIVEAEKLPLDVLEDTYVTHPGFRETVMDLIRSAILLAPHGGGKTAGRLRLGAILEQKQLDAVKELNRGGTTLIPLIVHYKNFEKIVGQLPAIDLTHHKVPLLESIAEAFLTYILLYPDLFLKFDQSLRDFWWAFLTSYLGETVLLFRLKAKSLMNDWRKISNLRHPFRLEAGLLEILQTLGTQFQNLQLMPVYILVDGLDGYLETQDLVKLEGLVLPLLNTLDLISSSSMVWKFFFPESLKDLVQLRSHSYQTGRLDVLSIRWDENSLRDFLHQRLVWASEGRILDTTQNCEQALITKVGNVDGELARLALRHSRLGPPRALLQLADQLHKCGNQPLLTLADWDYFLGSIQSEIP